MDEQRLAAMEKRIAALEAKLEELEAPAAAPADEACRLMERYPGELMAKEAAAVLGVDRSTIYRMVKAGELRKNQLGRITAASVAQMLTETSAVQKGRTRRPRRCQKGE